MHAACQGCRQPLERRPGSRGPLPRLCPTCKEREHAASLLTPAQRSELNRAAAEARWSAASEDERRTTGRHAAQARWAGHVAAPKRSREPRECPFCGVVVLMSLMQRSCGAPDCRLARNAERMQRYMHERRARLAENDFEPFEPREVYERDGWVCGICREPVDRALRAPDPGSVSLDHIVPVSHGGPHTRANTRCAHLGCNARKGNRTTEGALEAS